MAEHAARCPFCVNVVRLEPSFLERIGLRAGRQACQACRRVFDSRDAHTMGAAYGNWVDRFTHDLVAHVKELPMLADQVLHRALGSPPKDELRLIPTLEELVRSCAHHHRVVLIEMAKGRDATLDMAHMTSAEGTPETVAILGTASAESGAKELEQVIARSGVNHYVLYTYPAKNGAEPRVKRAIHSKAPHPHVGATPLAASHAAHASHAGQVVHGAHAGHTADHPPHPPHPPEPSRSARSAHSAHPPAKPHG